MGYSVAMMTTAAPDLTPGYPSKGTKLGPAWERLWVELDKASQEPDPYVEGRALALKVATDYGLNPSTLTALLSRAAKADLLKRDHRYVTGARGNRMRTHYAIPRKATQ